MATRATLTRRAIILTALRVEYLAVRAHLSNIQEQVHPQGTVYETGIFSSPHGQWEVIIAEIGAGGTSAAMEAERAITHFQPSHAFFVGVAGGLKDVKLGDVVAATKVYGYESGKAAIRFFPRPDVGKSTYRMVQRARSEARKPDWLQRIIGPAPSSTPNVLVAPIAAGEKVLKSTQSSLAKFLQSNYGDAVAVEMESHGMLQATYANAQVEALIIRGISDLIDNKTEVDAQGWQDIAARSASAFAFEILAKLTTAEPLQNPQVHDTVHTAQAQPTSPQPGSKTVDSYSNEHAVVEGIIQRRNRAFPTFSEPLNLQSPPSLTPKPKVSTTVKMILIATVVLIVFTLIGVFLLKNNYYLFTPSTSTTPNSTTTPISSPRSTFLYQADFSKGDQGWLRYAHSSQWSYNAKARALESDGSLYCCSSSTISTIIIVAPYTLTRSDYTVEARIRVTGINTSHPYTESDPGQEPFFGLYVQGDASNEEGYMAGINGLPTGEPHAGAYSTFLAYGPTLPQGKIFHGKESGGKDYVLDKAWHTYRLDVKAHTFMLSIDNIPVYSAPIQDNNFSSGPKLGIEDYDFYLQVQNFTVSLR